MSRPDGNPVSGEGGGTGRNSTFSQVIAGELPAKWVSNDPDSSVVCFHNKLRWARIMYLVVPREYMTQEQLWLSEDSPGVLQDALRLAVSVGEEHCPEGFRVLSNFGRGAHQSQLHAHIHVVSGIADNIATAQSVGDWESNGQVQVQRQKMDSVPHADLYRDDNSNNQFEFLTGDAAPLAATAAIRHAKSFSPLGFRLKANYQMENTELRGGAPGLFMLGGGQLDLYV